jgi:hypothetical protein
MSSVNRRGVVLVLSLVLVVAACGGHSKQSSNQTSTTSPPSSLFPNWPTEADGFRFHWSAASGIGLDSGPAVALRAYVESYRLAGFAGGDPSVIYPGFDAATPENEGTSNDPESLVQLQYVRPKTRAEYEAGGWNYVPRNVYGYQPTHILDLAPLGNGMRATVCLGLYSVYRTEDDDPHKFFSTIADPKTGQLQFGDREAVEIWRVELTDSDPRAQAKATALTAPQSGPMPAPVGNVFGRWFITGSSTGLWGPIRTAEQIDTPEVRKQCEDAMPDDAAARAAMANGFHDAPPPHGDPIPGWPAANP